MSFRAHSAPGSASRVLLRAALALSAAGAALAAGSGAAQAAGQTPAGGMLDGARSSLGAGLGPVKHLPLNPMGGTPVNPLANAVRTQVGDFKPVGTDTVTGPLAKGDSLSQMPLVGRAGDVLPG